MLGLFAGKFNFGRLSHSDQFLMKISSFGGAKRKLKKKKKTCPLCKVDKQAVFIYLMYMYVHI